MNKFAHQAVEDERVDFKLPNGEVIECFVADGVLRVSCDLQLVVYPRGANAIYLQAVAGVPKGEDHGR